MTINSSHFQIKPPLEIDLHSKLLEQFAGRATILRNEEIIEGQTVEKSENSKKVTNNEKGG